MTVALDLRGRRVINARGNSTKNGFAGGPLFRIIFLRRLLAFDFSFFCLSLFGHIAPFIPFQAGP